MRAWSLISLLVCAGCTVRMPRPGELGIRVKTTTRVETRVQTQAQVHVQGQAQVQGHVQVQAPPPPPPEPEVLVPIQGAPVVEFFGIPLENAQDVVFVLDISGSMTDPALGRLAEIQPASAPPPGPPPGPPPSAAPPPDAQPSAFGVPPPTVPPADGQPPPAVPPDSSPPPVDGQPAVVATVQLRKIDVAQAELADALARLPAGTRMNVIFFNSDLEGFAPTMVPLEETARPGLIEYVRSTIATGSTALAPAMRTAFLMNARRIVLLSDGLGNVGGNSASLLRDAREAMRGGVRIDTIGLGRSQDASLLRTLANESGGLYQAL